MNAENPSDQSLPQQELNRGLPQQALGRGRSEVLLDETLAMLAPLVQLLIANGVTYPQFVAALKPVFLRAAHIELSESNKRISDSALSLVSGVHRKDVRALMSDERLRTHGPDRVPSLINEVMARWASDARYVADDGSPRALPLRNGDAGEPSFEQLMQSVSRDFHSRAVLDEMSRLGVIEIVDDVAHLRLERSRADSSLVETMFFVGRNVHDHLAAVEKNLSALQAGDHSPFLEQSVFADELGPESIRALQELSRRIWDSALRRIASLATESAERDKQGGKQAMRMRFGVYFYAEPESPLISSGELPKTDLKE